MNNIKIKFYKKEDLASLRKYKRAIIILSITCLLLVIIMLVFFLNKDIFSSIYAAKSVKISEEIEKKEIVIAPTVEELKPVLKNIINNASGLESNNRFTEQNKVIIQNKKSRKIYHIVEKGQTLYSISKMYNVNIDDVVKLNTISDNTIYLNNSILIKTDN